MEGLRSHPGDTKARQPTDKPVTGSFHPSQPGGTKGNSGITGARGLGSRVDSGTTAALSAGNWSQRIATVTARDAPQGRERWPEHSGFFHPSGLQYLASASH